MANFLKMPSQSRQKIATPQFDPLNGRVCFCCRVLRNIIFLAHKIDAKSHAIIFFLSLTILEKKSIKVGGPKSVDFGGFCRLATERWDLATLKA